MKTSNEFEEDDEIIKNSIIKPNKPTSAVISNPMTVSAMTRQAEHVERNVEKREELPDLNINPTRVVLRWEFSHLSLSFCKFFSINLKTRYLLITTFCRPHILYMSYQKVLNLACQYFFSMLVLSFILVLDATGSMNHVKEKLSKSGLLIAYVIISEVLSCLLVHFTSFCFNIPIKKIRPIYYSLKNNAGIDFMKKFEEASL